MMNLKRSILPGAVGGEDIVAPERDRVDATRELDWDMRTQ
jgi:hypothetical protein